MRLFRCIVDNYLEPMDPPAMVENVHSHSIEAGILVLKGVAFTQYIHLERGDFAEITPQEPVGTKT